MERITTRMLNPSGVSGTRRAEALGVLTIVGSRRGP